MADSSSSTAAATSASIFHTNRTAALVPKDARNKSLLRKAIHEFADQFAAVLAQRLISYCQLRNSKTVDLKTLKRAAEDLLGARAGEAPAGVSQDDLPQTIIFSRFKRSLGGLRMEGGCAVVAASIGFNFLRHVQDIIDAVYTSAADPKAVEAESVIAQLERSHGHSPHGLPLIAYRPGLVVDNSAPVPRRKKTADAAAAAGGASSNTAPTAAAATTTPTSSPAKKGKKAAVAATEEATAAAVAAAAAPATKGKKRQAKGGDVEAAQGETEEGVAAAPAAAKAKAGKAGKGGKGGKAAIAADTAAAAAPVVSEEAASEPKRRKKGAAVAAASE